MRGEVPPDDTGDEASDLEEDELSFHDLFAVLRQEVVRVGSNFRRRVRHGVGNAERARSVSPRTGGLISSVLIQTLNLFTSTFASKTQDEDGSDGQ